MFQVFKKKIKLTPYLIISIVIGIGLIIIGVVYFITNYNP